MNIDIALIVNPKAGNGSGLKDWPIISQKLTEQGFNFKQFVTESKYHAIELAKNAVKEGFKVIISVGGDGTLHEVVNGVLTQDYFPVTDIAIGVIPVGSGNDWGRAYNYPSGYDAVIELIKRANTKIQDVAKVTYSSGKEKLSRYMMNIGGLGFDAAVCREFEKLKAKGYGGKKLYIKGLITAFFGDNTTRYRVLADDNLFYEGHAFSMALGIGQYSGGGMMQTPEALMDDGLVDLTIIKKTSKLNVLRHLPKVFTGNLYEVKSIISHVKFKKLEIISAPDNILEIDGEVVGHTPLTIEVIPQAIRVLV